MIAVRSGGCSGEIFVKLAGRWEPGLSQFGKESHSRFGYCLAYVKICAALNGLFGDVRETEQLREESKK